MFLKNKRLDGGVVGVVLIQFNKRFRPAAENVNKQRHLRSPLQASSQLQKNVIVVVGCFILPRPGTNKMYAKSSTFRFYFSFVQGPGTTSALKLQNLFLALQTCRMKKWLLYYTYMYILFSEFISEKSRNLLQLKPLFSIFIELLY
jgi:hypothetical protein